MRTNGLSYQNDNAFSSENRALGGSIAGRSVTVPP